MKKILLRLFLPFMIFLILSGAVYLLHTESGLNWLFRMMTSSVEGLSAETVQGRLSGPFTMRNIKYESGQADVQVGELFFDWKPSALLLLRAHVTEFRVEGVSIETRDGTEQPPAETELPEIKLPLDIIIDKASIAGMIFYQEGRVPVMEIQEILLGAATEKEALRIRHLRVKTGDAVLGLEGSVVPVGDYPLDIRTEWELLPEGFAMISGNGEVLGSLRDLNITQSINEPFSMKLNAVVSGILQGPVWSGDVTASAFNLRLLKDTLPDVRVSGKISGSGDGSQSEARGAIGVLEKRLGTVKTSFDALYKEGILDIRILEAEGDRIDTKIELTGSYSIEKNDFDVRGSWKSLHWPLTEREEGIKSSEGDLRAQGTPDNYTYSLNADLSGKNIPLTSLLLKGSGTLKGTVIETLYADLLGGTVTGKGNAGWDPDISWQLTGEGKSLNPGLHWPEWPGSLNSEFESSGNLKGKEVNIDRTKLSFQGKLRGRSLKGNSELTMSDGTVHIPEMKIHSGRSYVNVSGEVSEKWNLQWESEIPDLEDVIPGGAGMITGKGNVSGDRYSPDITASLRGIKIFSGENAVGAFVMEMDIDASDSRDSHIDVVTENIHFGKMKLNSAKVNAHGKTSLHTINVGLYSEDMSFDAAVEGRYRGRLWEGLISELEFLSGDYGKWTLRDPERITVSAETVGTGRLCLVDADGEICAQTHWTSEGGVTLNSDFRGVPLSIFKAAVPKQMSLEGKFKGGADLTHSSDKKSSGSVVFSVAEGAISYEHGTEGILRVPFEGVGVEGELDANALDLHFAASLKERGVIKGSVVLPHFDPLKGSIESQELKGALSMDLHTLDLIPAFTSVLEDPRGAMTVNMTAGGTVARPAFAGTAELRDGSALVPDLGINIRDIHARVKGSSSGDITLNAGMSSGGGTASIEGRAGFRGKGISMDFRIQGENFEAVKVPELRLLASPDITVRLTETQINIDGTLLVPEALMEPRDLSNAVARSGDVHIIDSRVEGEREKKRKIFSNVKVVLGEKVRFKGFGLAGGIEGALRIREEPETPTKGQGELNITNGLYKAYGQELNIEKGRLLFVGLVDNPGLDIRAVRRIGDITAGVNVGGTLRSPQLTLFSQPAMDQGDALSYLLFGRPLNRLSGSEGDQLHGAASSAALSGGEFIAKKIGAAFGLEEVEIEKGETAEEATLFMGKYLSPRLYVSYGVGLFEPINILRLRYHLTPRWSLQSEYGLESGGDLLYSIER